MTAELLILHMNIWRRKWQPTPVYLSGKSHGQRSPWGCERVELDFTAKQQQSLKQVSFLGKDRDCRHMNSLAIETLLCSSDCLSMVVFERAIFHYRT